MAISLLQTKACCHFQVSDLSSPLDLAGMQLVSCPLPCDNPVFPRWWVLSLEQPSRLFKLPLQDERTNLGSVRHLHLPSRACTYKKHCTLTRTHIHFKDLVKKPDETKKTKTKPQILLHTCSPETQFITFGAAVHVEPSFIALGTCITATFTLPNTSS